MAAHSKHIFISSFWSLIAMVLSWTTTTVSAQMCVVARTTSWWESECPRIEEICYLQKPDCYESTDGCRATPCTQFSNSEIDCVLHGCQYRRTIAGGGGNRGSAKLYITVKHDNSPEETAWTLSDSTGMVIASQAPYSKWEWEPWVWQQYLLPPGTYTFLLTDEGGDGICCDNGWGYVELKVGDMVVASSDGEFGYEFQATFTIGSGGVTGSPNGTKHGTVRGWKGKQSTESANSSPVPPPCLDSVDGTFKVNKHIGAKTCAWLSANQETYGFLCEYMRVAKVCPETCGTCPSP